MLRAYEIGPGGLGSSFGTPRSAPSKTRSHTSSSSPAISSSAENGTPVHSAVPTAPSSHCAPGAGGERKTRLLPAHSSVATHVLEGMARISLQLRLSWFLTAPVI